MNHDRKFPFKNLSFVLTKYGIAVN
eukprot:COSAG06_NODE_61595_length_267_cov_0.619048_1_plen_24_part_01